MTTLSALLLYKFLTEQSSFLLIFDFNISLKYHPGVQPEILGPMKLNLIGPLYRPVEKFDAVLYKTMHFNDIFDYHWLKRARETEKSPQTTCNDANWHVIEQCCPPSSLGQLWGDLAAADSSVGKSAKRIRVNNVI